MNDPQCAALEHVHNSTMAERRGNSVQSSAITEDHVRDLTSSGAYSGNEPLRLSLEVWGHMDLCLQGNEKIAFNNVDPGNGFDAWR